MKRIPNVTRQAQKTARLLSDWCEGAGIVHSFPAISGGGHCQINYEVNGQNRKMSFAATPTCRRSPANALTALRNAARELGWKDPK